MNKIKLAKAIYKENGTYNSTIERSSSHLNISSSKLKKSLQKFEADYYANLSIQPRTIADGLDKIDLVDSDSSVIDKNKFMEYKKRFK